jgi:8-oxo-dGTP pyrophosphatase MutT (NUDIX family)
LPGGLIEPGETSQNAALRELAEELGVSSSGLEILGQLSEIYLFNSNYRVAPWIAATVARPAWLPNPAEVDQLLEVPLADLLNPGSVKTVVRQQRGLTISIPCFDWSSHCIWGATSMILGELVAILAEVGV